MKRKRPTSNNHGSIRIQAYEHMRRMILSGELAPESIVSEGAIAEKLGSSRTPVREAIGQMVAEGLVEQTPNRGTTVVRFTRQDIVELYELREALEAYAARKAASFRPHPAELEQWKNATDGILALKDELERSGEQTLNPEQMQRFVAIDFAFHTMLMHLAGNGRIVKVVNDSRLLIRIFTMDREAYSAKQLVDLHREHQKIIQAIAGGTPDAAAKIISRHIQNSRQERLAAFELWEREALLRKNIPGFDWHPSSPPPGGSHR